MVLKLIRKLGINNISSYLEILINMKVVNVSQYLKIYLPINGNFMYRESQSPYIQYCVLQKISQTVNGIHHFYASIIYMLYSSLVSGYMTGVMTINFLK